MENIQSEQQKEKQILKTENSLRDLWNNIKHNNIYITEVLEGEAEKAMAPNSSTVAWKIPWTEEPGGLPSMGSHRVGHDWSDAAAAAEEERTKEVKGYLMKLWLKTSWTWRRKQISG